MTNINEQSRLAFIREMPMLDMCWEELHDIDDDDESAEE